MINKVILVGNLGGDPEVSYAASGTAIAKFTVATSEKWKDKNSGEMQEKTEWHRITAFGRLAEICGEYLTKGRQVYLEGRIQTSSYEKDGVKRYSTEIIIQTMKMLGQKGDSDGSSYQHPQQGQSRSQQQHPEIVDDEEDSIPF